VLAKIILLVISLNFLIACQKVSILPDDKTAITFKVLPIKASSVEDAKVLKKSLAGKSIQQIVFTATITYLKFEGGFYDLIAKDGKQWYP
jgi:hypothetical protein